MRFQYSSSSAVPEKSRRSMVSRKTLPESRMASDRRASSAGLASGSTKKTSMKREDSRSSCFLMREKAFIKSAKR